MNRPGGGGGWWGRAGARRNIGRPKICDTSSEGGDLRTAWQRSRETPEDKPISEIIMEKSRWPCARTSEGQGCITKLPRIPIIETTQWHPGQFSAPLLK